jgi:hypothetical protein
MVAHMVEALCYKPEGPGSIPDGVTEIFHKHNPSGCTMALGATQPLTEMSTRNISWQINLLPLLFKALLHGQKDCVFSAGI